METSASNRENQWTSGLNEAFDTDYTPSEDTVGDMLTFKEKMELEKNEIVTKVKNAEELTLRDAELIRSEIQEMIASSKFILDTMEQTLQVGAPPRAFEVYATLIHSRLAILKELKDLSKTEIDVKVINNKVKGPDSVNNNLVIMMDDAKLEAMVKKIESKNSLDEIDVDFEVDEGDAK